MNRYDRFWGFGVRVISSTNPIYIYILILVSFEFILVSASLRQVSLYIKLGTQQIEIWSHTDLKSGTYFSLPMND